MTVYLPTVAICISVASLVLSVLNYLRDRAQIRVWSEIISYPQGPDPDSETLLFRIHIANLGRRPAVLLNLVMVAGEYTWFRTIKAPPLQGGEQLKSDELIKLLQSHWLAQNASLKLAEGDAVDLQFWPDDYPNFLFMNVDPMLTAEKLYIEDCAGRRYRVKNDGNNLRKLFKTRHL